MRILIQSKIPNQRNFFPLYYYNCINVLLNQCSLTAHKFELYISGNGDHWFPNREIPRSGLCILFGEIPRIVWKRCRGGPQEGQETAPERYWMNRKGWDAFERTVSEKSQICWRWTCLGEERNWHRKCR